MKLCGSLLSILVVVLIALVLLNEMTVEGYRGHGHHGGHGGHRGGRRWGRRWGRRGGYGYGRRYQPPQPSYLWYNPWYWFRGVCKNGCTSIGNGNWGCQYPGMGANDCIFANDCYGCGQ